MKLLKPVGQAASNAKAAGGNKPKPTKAILKNIQNYVKQNIVKPGKPVPVAAPKAKAINRVGTSKGGVASSAVQTAASIASNPAHPRNKDVRELLNTFQKGWVDENKFKELLQGMVV